MGNSCLLGLRYFLVWVPECHFSFFAPFGFLVVLRHFLIIAYLYPFIRSSVEQTLMDSSPIICFFIIGPPVLCTTILAFYFAFVSMAVMWSMWR